MRSLPLVAVLATRASAEPVVLPAGELDGQLVTEINVGAPRAGAPLSVAPDAWIGVTDRLTLGIVHSNPSVDRFTAGASLCVRHEVNRCDATYHGSGLDVRWGALDAPVALAPRARLLVRDLDPWKPAVTVGALVSWTTGPFTITGDPYLQLGLANTGEGNRHALFVPVAFAVRPPLAGDRWQLAVHTGWYSDLAVIRDGWHIPVAFATRVAVTSELDVGAMLGFATLLGPQNTAKERALFVTVALRRSLL